jgi:hypothetical protein
VQVCKVQVEMVQATWGDCVVNDGPGTALAMGVYHACLGYTHAFGQRSRQLEFSEAALRKVLLFPGPVRVELGSAQILLIAVHAAGATGGKRAENYLVAGRTPARRAFWSDLTAARTRSIGITRP